MSTKLIQSLEERSYHAWPPAIVQIIDGWRLRFDWGVTRRANSVWANGVGDQHALSEKLALVEDFYHRRGHPARYQICPANHPANLDDILAQRGYHSLASTQVRIADLSTVLPRTEPNPAFALTLTDSFGDIWFATYCRIEQIDHHSAQRRREILRRIDLPTGFALLRLEGHAAAVGMSVIERGWAGIFCMATDPGFRRQGAATTVLHGLARWSQGQQATRIYLQVMEINEPAQRLYARAGFEYLYSYHYREAPPTD